jgi:hypothetical protein
VRTAIQNRGIKTFFLFQIFLFLLFLFICRGLPTGEAIRITLIIVLQTYVGATIWRCLTKTDAISMLELIATGFALGSALFTVIDQGLIFLGLVTNDAVIPCLLILIALATDRLWKNLSEISEISQHDLVSLLVVSICVFTGFGELSHGSFLAVVILATACILIIKRNMSLFGSAALSATSLGMAVFVFFLVKPPIAYGSWFLRPLFTKTDDAVFSESVAYSLSIFGPSDYAAASGTSLRYHWFSLAWSGLIQRSASVSPFGMTLHVVPVVSFLVIAMLLIAIAKRIGLKQRYLFIAPLVLFFANSAPTPLYFYFVINTSNVLTYIWSLTFLLVFVLHTEKKIHFGQYLLGLTAGIVLLSKIPYAVALLGGTATSSMFVFFTNRQSRKSVFSLISVIALFTVSLFLLFLTPNSWEKRTYLLDWNLMNIAPGSQFRFLIAFGCIAVLLFTRFPLFFIRNKTWELTFLKVFIWGAVSTGIVRFVVNGNSAEEYFLNSALVFGSLGLALAVNELTPEVHHFRTWELLGTGYCSGLLSLSVIEIWNRINFQDGRWSQSNLQIVVPSLVAGLTCIGVVALKRRSLGPEPIRLTALLLVFCLIGANAGMYVVRAVKSPVYAPRGSIATDVDLSSLRWLRINSDPSEMVATNRFLCPGNESCDFDESSFLISAVANRQVYIEGPRFVSGGRPYPSWMTERISASRSFAEAPSAQNFDKLRASGVSWFYLDTNFLPADFNVTANPWQKWALIEHQSSNILILRFIP